MRSDKAPSELTVDRKCPVCKSVMVEFAFRKRDEYLRCNDCGLGFIFPRPTEEELKILYDDIGSSYFINEQMLDFEFSRHKNRREISFLKSVRSTGRLLDVGCCVGSFVKAAQDMGYLAEGIDISEPAVEYGQSLGLRLRAGNVLQVSYPYKFDIVTMWAVLEHLPDPAAFVMKAHEFLADGGLFLAAVPNSRGITRTLIGTKDRYVCSEHLNEWDFNSFGIFLHHCGFRIMRRTSWAFNPLVFLQDALGHSPEGDSRGKLDEQISCASLTLRVKRSPLGYAQDIVERALALLDKGDAIAVAAMPI